MTVTETINVIRNLDLTCRYNDGEYRINYYDGREGTAYYTNDSDDALATARHMAANPPCVPQSPAKEETDV